jgi:NADPH-dependent stearoyl-CoA 9-desaturase
MAITEVAAYAHLSAADIEALGRELDQIRQDIQDQRGTRDATYIRRTITFQRTLDAAA